MSFDRVDFVQMRGESVSPISGQSSQGRSGSKVGIAAGTVSFVLAAILLGGLFRKDRQQKRKKARSKNKEMVSRNGKRFLLGSAPRKYYELDEDQENGSGFKVLDIGEPPYYENPSVTWSISDITSESGSILSNISRTTSKLARIEEVEEEYPTDDEWDGTDTDDCNAPIDSIPAEYLYGSSSPRHHVSQYDATEECTEPDGCRYLDDSSHGEDSVGVVLSEVEDYALECSDHSDSDEEDETIDVAELEEYLPKSPDDSGIDDDLDGQMMESILNISDEITVETTNETRAVLHETARDWDEVSDTSGNKWMVAVLKELRKSQRRKLLTYVSEE